MFLHAPDLVKVSTWAVTRESKEEGKDQESMQSRTTPDLSLGFSTK